MTGRNLTLVSFKQNLTAMIERDELALPSTVEPQAFRNAAIVAAQTNPAILNCSPESVFTSIRHLAGMGLVPDSREAALVPFKGKAQAMPMVYGIIKAVKQSGQVKSLFADVVYEGETIETWIEDGERKFNHVMEDGSKINPMTRGGDVIGAYAVAKLKDGTVEFEPMSLHEIELRRKASPTQKGPKPTGIWADWYGEMAKKTVIRAIAKRLPMSSEDQTRITADPTFQDVPIKDVTPNESSEERLMRLKQEREQAEAEPEADQPLEGEIIDAPEGVEFDTKLVTPMDKEFDEGVLAHGEGIALSDNPYDQNPQFSIWHGGWLQAEEFAKEEAAAK